MAAGTKPIFYATPKTAAVQLTNATGAGVANAVQLLAAGANGALVLGIEAVTEDTAANDVGLFVQLAGSGTKYPIGGKTVPLRSGDVIGQAPIAACQLLDMGQMPFLLPDGSLQLGASDALWACVRAAVTSGKTLTLLAQYGDY